MIIRDLTKARATEREVSDARWTSIRLLLRDDGMGFSFHVTIVEAGSEHRFHYKNHLESVFCMAGEGSITDLASGETHAIRPGVLYALDRHDDHVLRATSELHLACVFNPPVTGNEVHRADGSYAAAAD